MSFKRWNNVKTHNAISTLKQRHDTQSHFNVGKTSRHTSFWCWINVTTHNVISTLKQCHGTQRHFSVDTTILHTTSFEHWKNVRTHNVMSTLEPRPDTQCHFNIERTSWHTTSFIRVITKLPKTEQSSKGKGKTHKSINRQNQSTTGKLGNVTTRHPMSFQSWNNVTSYNFISQLK